MQQIRKKLTYANAMSSLAVFLVLGGASAFAAAHLRRNSVGSSQLKPGAVTSSKLRRSAVTELKIHNGSVTTEKIQNGAVTAAKLGAAAIGANQLGTDSVGNAQTQLVKVFKLAPVPAAANEAAAPRIDIGTVGPFGIYAKCFHDGNFVESQSFIELTSGSATLNGVETKQEFGYLTPSSPPAQRLIGSATAGADSFGSEVNSSFQATASDGTEITGTIVNGAKAGAPAGGNGPFLAADSCLVGPVTVLGG